MEHIDLIKQIIDAEQRARQLSEETLQKREAMQRDLKQTAAQLRESYFERANARLEKIREREAALAIEQQAELDKIFDQDMRNIESAFDKHQDEWADKLFDMIVSDK